MGWQSRNEHAPAWTAFFDGVDDPLWAERTRTRHRNILLRFLVWQEYHGLGTGTNNNKDNKKRGNEAKRIARFIRALTREVSGEAMLSNARSLLKTLRRHISTRKQRVIRTILPVWRRDANMLNPPRRQAAEAVSMQTLKKLLKRVEETQLTSEERQALDIFMAVFESMSRVAEIADLHINEVTRGRKAITI